MKKNNKLVKILLSCLGVFALILSFFIIPFNSLNVSYAADTPLNRYELDVVGTNYNQSAFNYNVFNMYGVKRPSLVSGTNDFLFEIPQNNDINSVSYKSYLDSVYQYTQNSIYYSCYLSLYLGSYGSTDVGFQRTNFNIYRLNNAVFVFLDANNNVVKSYYSSDLSNVLLFNNTMLNINYVIDDLGLSNLYDIFNYKIGVSFTVVGTTPINTNYVCGLSFNICSSSILRALDIDNSYMSSFIYSNYVNNFIYSSYSGYRYFNDNLYSVDNTNYSNYWQNYYQDYFNNVMQPRAYDDGYSAGFLAGSDSSSTLPRSILAFASYPFTLLSGFLNFNLFGFNIYNLVLAFITTLLCIWLIKKIK